MQLLYTIANNIGSLVTLVRAVDVELSLLALFVAGFFLFRASVLQQVFQWFRQGCKARTLSSTGSSCTGTSLLAKQIVADAASGNAQAVLDSWAALEHFTPATLQAVVEALVVSGRVSEIVETLRQILARHKSMNSAEALAAVLDVLPESSQHVVIEVRRLFGRASANQPKRSAALSASGGGPGAHAHAMRIRAAVRGKKVDEAVDGILAMHAGGFSVPSACLVSLIRLASEADSVRSVLEALHPSKFVLSGDDVAAMFDYAGKAGNAELLKVLHDHISHWKIGLSPAGYDALVKGYASMGDSCAVKVFEEALESGHEPSEGALTMIVSSCAESRHVQMAERAVEYGRKSHGHISLALYSALMKVYQHARLFHKTCDLYTVMKNEGVHPDTVTYGCLIKAAVEGGRLDLAQHLFKESGSPDLLNYMSLIRAAGREHNVPKALSLLEELEKSAIGVDTTAYNCVLEVCVACRDRGAAKSLLARMEATEHVDVISFNTFLKLLIADGAHSEIEATLARMRTLGLRLSVVTYNSLVNASITQKDLPAAWRLIDEMEREGVRPDAFTCSILMKGVKHSSSPTDVDKVIAMIDRAKVTPDEVLVNCLLDACVRLRNVERLSRVLDTFKATGVVPSLHACATLLRAYGHARRLDQAWVLWRELTEERAMTPNEELFGSMIDACLANGDLDGATTIFRSMSKKLSDFSKSSAAFSGLIKACVQRKQTRRALEIYDIMQDATCICSKVMYNTLIDGLVRHGDMEQASRIFRDMALNAVSPDLITFSTMIKGHCARGDLEQALMLFSRMRKQGISPDAILFNSILDGCAHKQMRSLTEQVMEDMEECGIAPSNFTLSILVKLYGRCGDLDAAFQAVETLPKKHNFDVNAQVFTCLMSTCITHGQLAKALEVYERMAAVGCTSDAKTYQTLLNGCLKHDDLDSAARVVHDAINSCAGSRPVLDSETVEGVLFMMARRGRSEDLGMPLMERLSTAGVPISERVRVAVHGGSVSQEPAPTSRFHQRRNR